MARNPNCADCDKPLSKPRFSAGKRKCYSCEVAARRAGKRKAHDRAVESEDFTAQDYWHLYEQQNGHCAIPTCRAQGKSKHLAVEHDHACEMGHDKNRWCRVCVRGLTCNPHNEWIGRSGDNPEVFDSLAAYLRDPPARKAMMEKMIVGTADETVVVLVEDYNVPFKRACKMLELARKVGPSPAQVNGSTIEVRYIKIPRTDKVLYEIIESEPRIDGQQAIEKLMEMGMTERRAKTALNKAWENGENKVSARFAIARITYHGRGVGQAYMFSITS